MNFRRVSTAFIIIIILVSFPIYQFSHGSHASTRSVPDEPAITFTTDLDEAYIDESSWSAGEIGIPLTILCIPTNPSSGQKVEMWLNSSAGNWNVSEIPILFFYEAPWEIHVNLTVSEFTNSSVGTSVDLEIWGEWRYTNSTRGGSIGRHFVSRIEVLPVYNIRIGSNNPYKVADIGDWTEFSFKIFNQGNTDINVTIEMVKDYRRVKLELSNDTFFIKKGDFASISFRAMQEPSRSRENPMIVHARIIEDPSGKVWEYKMQYTTEPTIGTIFYEGNFQRLVLIVFVIISISAGLFIWERAKKRKEVDSYEAVESPKNFKRAKKPTKGLYKDTNNKQR